MTLSGPTRHAFLGKNRMGAKVARPTTSEWGRIMSIESLDSDESPTIRDRLARICPWQNQLLMLRSNRSEFQGVPPLTPADSSIGPF